MNAITEKMSRYLDAGFPILYITSFEEEKIDLCITEAAKGRHNVKIVEWNGANGIVDFNTKVSQVKLSLLDALELYDDPEELENTILVIKDFPTYFEEPAVLAKMKNLVRKITAGDGVEACIVLVSDILSIPKELEKYITIIETEHLMPEEIEEAIEKFREHQGIPAIDKVLKEQLVVALKGLSEFEINSILSLAYADDGALTKKDLQLVFERKQQMIKKAGILEMVQLDENVGLDAIGGLEVLKKWLGKKAKVLGDLNRALEFGVDMPKGVMIVGVPGCGKSLTAKAAAKLFNVPLLKLDMGRLMGKYVGESEANMRKAIELAEAIAPCVLWVDELEKAFAGIGGEGGGAEITTRLLGSFLTWMQEKTSATFVVATANNISKLPPELLRKGRFDEIFYVNLPNEKERKQIFEIHIKKRRPQDFVSIDFAQLAKKTDGFSGADIEGVVKDSVEAAFESMTGYLTTNTILLAIGKTHSLYQLWKDKIDKIIAEYKDRKFKNASQ